MEKRLIGMARAGGGGGGAPAARCGELVFVGGQTSLDAAGRVVGDDLKTQARNAFEALKSALAAAGVGFRDVVKHNVYLSCDGDADAQRQMIDDLNDVRATLFTDPGPTTTEIFCGLDRPGARILVDAWAIDGRARRERLAPAGHWTWRRPLPFSQGWKVGDLIFVGGQRSLDARGQALGVGDIEVQTDHAFRNLDTMLRAAGGDRHSLMRQNTYFRFVGQGREVTDYWEKMTAVRRRYMAVPSAAGAGLRVRGLASPDELIQVEGVASLSRDRTRLQPANHWDWSIPNTQFTQGWRAGDLAFIGGQISADREARAVGADLATQTRNVYRFVRRVLGEAGLDERDVAKLFIYYYGPDDAAGMAEARATVEAITREFYGDARPAETVARVSGFAFEDLLVEVEAMAIRRDGQTNGGVA